MRTAVVLLTVSALLCACNTPMDAAPLPEPRVAQLSLPAVYEPDSGSPRVYILDGNLLSAYFAGSANPVWSREVGYSWHPAPTAGNGGRVYVITYDPDFPPDRPNYVLHGFNIDGSPIGTFQFNQRPTQPVLLGDGTLVIGLTSERKDGGGSRSVAAEPQGATLVALTPGLELAWFSAVPDGPLRTPVFDGQFIFAGDATQIHIVRPNGEAAAAIPAEDAGQLAQYAASTKERLTYILSGSQLQCYERGSQKWSVDLPAVAAPGSLHVAAVGPVVLLSDGTVLALAAEDGAERWRYPAPDSARTRIAVAPDGSVLISLDGGGAGSVDTLIRLDADGSELWESPLPERVTGPLAASGAGFYAVVSRVRDAQRAAVLQLDSNGARLQVIEARQTLSGFVVNGHSTLDPPWPAIE